MSERERFNKWMERVDRVLGAYGLSHLDLADQTWWDWFEDGYTPAEAARETLENEGFPF